MLIVLPDYNLCIAGLSSQYYQIIFEVLPDYPQEYS